MPATASKLPTVGRKRVEPDLTTYSGRLAARIRELRDERRLTVQEVADKSGIPLYTLYGYENGRREIPLDLLPALAKALRCKTPDDLLPPFQK